MTIIVCPLSRAPHIARLNKVSHVVSLLDPDTPFPIIKEVADRHLRLEVHDIEEDEEGMDPLCATRTKHILDFVGLWDRSQPILIHCYAGISRSTATAFITACAHNPDIDERAIAKALRDVSPTATPNRRFVALADAALARKGRMSAAIEAIGRGYPRWPDIREAEPFTLPSRFAA
ncbi:MAG: protein tyrosine phosphatase [Hyphomonadaceae bacterium]|nr:protein tyrosine phosphatase [Hyphomonadaceae bacterium]